MDIPWIISVDDHVVEPPALWQDRLPAALRVRGPRVVRQKGAMVRRGPGRYEFTEAPADPASRWCDVWWYEDLRTPMVTGYAAIGPLADRTGSEPVTYDEYAPGAYQQQERLRDMDANHVEASLCFPTFPRFCGQTFEERKDRDLALLCVRAYNDWMIDEWCSGEGRGRLVPLTLIPLWDVVLAAAEVQRCAAKGSHAIAFSECPPYLGLPSIHSGAWDPLWQACVDTDTTVNMHIGSSSRMPSTSMDAPIMVGAALQAQNSSSSLVDWLASGVLVRYPALRIIFSEGQVGWMPYYLERLDSVWDRGARYDRAMTDRLPDRPSSYIRGRVFGCVFDDAFGLRNRDSIGMEQIMFETDYPHTDSTFPHSRAVAERLVTAAGLDRAETHALLRGNAIHCYQLQAYGIEA
jgi:predicted TIM-barrel fold metal-dependent hydrolase